ncbi:MAG: phosphoribosylformylglycinamidine cyclo-ligase [Candidatus Fermentibacteraceae bacterium]|nr:phosphoribosylformylglycinamidine cyclo-ligase [Candidatus Fermentibacteraceae bacterium]
MSGIDYRDSGVNIDEGLRAVELMKKEVKKTFNENVLSELGHFGGLFKADFPGMTQPVLVASMDGVGTKLKVAALKNDYTTVGRDLVNHCVNDILVQGAHPLFFLDYIACGKLDASVAADIVTGLATACFENGCALLGGETAEMPGFYNTGDYDVAGTIVGSVDKGMIIDGTAVAPGHGIVGLPSSGLHTNGYSLARAVLFEKAALTVHDHHSILGDDTVGEALLKVHRSYLKQVKPLLEQGLATGMAHITGGGIPGNLIRILPDGCGAFITPGWPVPPVFKLIKELGGIAEVEMRRAFNLGAGFLIVTPEPEKVIELLRQAGEKPFHAGVITQGSSIEYEEEGA